MRLPLKQFLDQRAHFRNARGTTHQHDFVNLLRLQVRIFQRLLAGADGAVDDGLYQLLILIACNLAPIALTVRQFDIKFYGRLRRQRDLGLDHGFSNGLHGLGIAAQIEV